MKKPGKIALGLVTLWPFFYLILFFVLIFSMILLGPGSGGGSGPPPLIALIFPLHLLTMLIVIGLTIFYIVDVFKNNRVHKDQKALWAIVIFLGNMIAMPIYWYLYIWKAEPVTGSSAPEQLGSADSSSWTNEVRAQSPKQEQYVPPSEPPNWR